MEGGKGEAVVLGEEPLQSCGGGASNSWWNMPHTTTPYVWEEEGERVVCTGSVTKHSKS